MRLSSKACRASAGRFSASAAVVAALASGFCPAAQAAPPLPAVTVTRIAVKNVAPIYSFIGRVIAIHSVKVVPRVTAFIDKVAVEQGSAVKPGQVLFLLQKAQYQAAVESARAKLMSAQAALRQAQLAYQRSAKLAARGYETQANLDAAIATRDQDKAAVLSAQANLAQAKLDLGYCTITSPIAGRIGTISLTKGNLVTPTTPALATINQLDPIRVVFSVSYRVIISTEQKTGVSPGKLATALTLQLLLPNGTKYKPKGKIAFLNNQVNSQTGTVSVYADFPNPKRLLLPGTYVTVDVRRARLRKRPLVPAEALQTNRSGSFVLVVGPADKVRQQHVALGPQIAQDFVVRKGLAGGERVIVAGMQKVRPGEKVRPVPARPGSQASGESGAAQGEAQSGLGR